MNILDKLERNPEDIHAHGCDCEWCWLGVAVNAAIPPSLWGRAKLALSKVKVLSGEVRP